MAVTNQDTTRNVYNKNYEVRPDIVNNESELTNFKEDGRIFFDDTDKINKYWNGTGWVETGNIISGWASYNDTQYTSGAPFTISSNTDTALPNNAGSVVDSQKPTDITTFYDGSVITGRNGDNLDVQIYFKALPSAQNQWLEVWIDIGGSVGELYRETFSFPRGAGVERGIMYSLASSYTLGTWEANGGTVYVRSNASLNIYDIVYNLDRSHKAI